MTRHSLLLCVPAIALAGACSSGHSSPTDAGDDDAQFASCLALHSDKGVMPYAAGVSTMSSGGSYTVTLVTNQPGYPEDHMPPGPEVKGVNTWALQVVDGSMAPVDGVIPMMNGVSPYMPDHQHRTHCDRTGRRQLPDIAPLPLHVRLLGDHAEHAGATVRRRRLLGPRRDGGVQDLHPLAGGTVRRRRVDV